MNRSITSNEIESVILKHSTNRSPGPDVFTSEFYQTATLLKLSPKKPHKKEHFQTHSEASIIVIPKLNKDLTQKRKLQANITDEHRGKNPQQNSSNQKPKTY